MQKGETRTKVIPLEDYELRCRLQNSTLTLEVTTHHRPHHLFFTVISPDAMPSAYQVLFETPVDMFEYLADEDNDPPEVDEPI